MLDQPLDHHAVGGPIRDNLHVVEHHLAQFSIRTTENDLGSAPLELHLEELTALC